MAISHGQSRRARCRRRIAVTPKPEKSQLNANHQAVVIQDVYKRQAPTKPEDPALAWGKAKGLLTDSNLEKPVTRAELVRVLYKLKGE